ncbi:hypothetical protein BH24ACT26_BH24ACT26_12280 [soil metagenome]
MTPQESSREKSDPAPSAAEPTHEQGDPKRHERDAERRKDHGTERRGKDEKVEEASEDSFPTSDPPAW